MIGYYILKCYEKHMRLGVNFTLGIQSSCIDTKEKHGAKRKVEGSFYRKGKRNNVSTLLAKIF